ncbi:MAG: hypothetical protein GY854_10165 [Deltaproteobacteria bacterium]|nr:hypothetical protein [Deltaproteobacteria bacterium]
MIYQNPKELLDRVAEVTGRSLRQSPTIFEDTTSYMNIMGGSVLRLADNDYYVITDAREGRFGIDDQPKFWVKYVFDLESGEKKIIKLVFYEEFGVQIGGVKIRCSRSPQKEADILEMVRGEPRFMQGTSVEDPVGNLARIIEIVPGHSLYKHITDIEVPHEEYFFQMLPPIMRQVIGCIEALVDLHAKGQHHGDVRNDHIIINNDTGLFTWIDFDYSVNYADYDIWSIGNVLIRVAGKGTHTQHDIRTHPGDYPDFKGTISRDDTVLLFKNRVANLSKLFPYITPALNKILMRFSVGATDFYTDLNHVISDLKEIF